MASHASLLEALLPGGGSQNRLPAQRSRRQRQNTVDKKARLLTFSEPASNEYAQANASGRHGSLSRRDRRRRQSRRRSLWAGPSVSGWTRMQWTRSAKRPSRRRFWTASRFPCCWTWWCSSAFIRREPVRLPSRSRWRPPGIKHPSRRCPGHISYAGAAVEKPEKFLINLVIMPQGLKARVVRG